MKNVFHRAGPITVLWNTISSNATRSVRTSTTATPESTQELKKSRKPWATPVLSSFGIRYSLKTLSNPAVMSFRYKPTLHPLQNARIHDETHTVIKSRALLIFLEGHWRSPKPWDWKWAINRFFLFSLHYFGCGQSVARPIYIGSSTCSLCDEKKSIQLTFPPSHLDFTILLRQVWKEETVGESIMSCDRLL